MESSHTPSEVHQSTEALPHYSVRGSVPNLFVNSGSANITLKPKSAAHNMQYMRKKMNNGGTLPYQDASTA